MVGRLVARGVANHACLVPAMFVEGVTVPGCKAAAATFADFILVSLAPEVRELAVWRQFDAGCIVPVIVGHAEGSGYFVDLSSHWLVMGELFSDGFCSLRSFEGFDWLLDVKLGPAW